MARYQVRYHRAVLDSSSRVMYPAGAIVDSLDLIPAAQHDKLIVIDDGGEQVKKVVTVTIKPAAKKVDKDLEC